MIDSNWKRIAGVHVQGEGEIAAVWMAHETDADRLHLYDCCIFRREVLAVIAEGINCRGRWIPIAWHEEAKDIADKLLDRGCNMLPEPCKDTEAMAEVVSREIWERMRTDRFKVDKRLAEWLDEYRSFYREDSQVPRTSHPMMSATRHAVSQLEFARRQAKRSEKRVYPKMAIV